MNMSLVPTIPSDGIHFPFKPKHDPVNVIFNLTLFECSRLPPNIETVWVFGDGTSENRFIQTEFEYIHEFKMRGNYTMTFTILDRSCVPDSPVWYSTQNLSTEAMNKMLHRIRLVREIQEAKYHTQPVYATM